MKKQVGLALSALALSIGAVSQVNAEALAVSVVELTNFTISREDTNAQLDVSDFASLTFQSTADTSASLNGFTIPDTGTSPDGTPLDLYSVVGTPPTYSDNDFTHLSSFAGDPTGNFAIGDQEEEGAPITGLTTLTGDPVGSPANLRNASYVSLESQGDGSAFSNNGLTSTVSFVSGFTDELVFSYDIDVFMEVFLSAGTAGDASVNATVSFSLLDLTAGGVELLNFGLGEGFTQSRSAPVPGTGAPLNVAFSAPQTFTSATLTAGNEYQLTARILTAADANFEVPEPGSLALMGLGLIGVGSLRRKAASKAS